MSDEEFDKKMVELKVQLNHVLEQMLHEYEYEQRQGWNVRNNVKWNTKPIYLRKVRKILKHGLKT